MTSSRRTSGTPCENRRRSFREVKQVAKNKGQERQYTQLIKKLDQIADGLLGDDKKAVAEAADIIAD